MGSENPNIHKLENLTHHLNEWVSVIYLDSNSKPRCWVGHLSEVNISHSIELNVGEKSHLEIPLKDYKILAVYSANMGNMEKGGLLYQSEFEYTVTQLLDEIIPDSSRKYLLEHEKTELLYSLRKKFIELKALTESPTTHIETIEIPELPERDITNSKDKGLQLEKMDTLLPAFYAATPPRTAHMYSLNNPMTIKGIFRSMKNLPILTLTLPQIESALKRRIQHLHPDSSQSYFVFLDMDPAKIEPSSRGIVMYKITLDPTTETIESTEILERTCWSTWAGCYIGESIGGHLNNMMAVHENPIVLIGNKL